MRYELSDYEWSVIRPMLFSRATALAINDSLQEMRIEVFIGLL